jgi:hypothetical protein
MAPVLLTSQAGVGWVMNQHSQSWSSALFYLFFLKSMAPDLWENSAKARGMAPVLLTSQPELAG